MAGCLVHVFRYGKANLTAPIPIAFVLVLAVTLLLALYQTNPPPIPMPGIELTIIAALLMGFEEAGTMPKPTKLKANKKLNENFKFHILF